MSGRNSQVSRIYAILNLLEGAPQGLTVLELTSRVNDLGHDSTKRTIYRDIEALEAAGFPLYNETDSTEDKAAGRWKLERTARVSNYLTISPRELIGLYLAKQVLTPLKETPFYKDLDQLFSKIEEKLGKKNQDHLKELSQSMHFEPGPIWGLGIDPTLLDTVHAACAENQVLSCTYASVNSKSKKVRRLGPHYLYFAKGSLYLVAEEMDTHIVKTFSLPRMSDAEMLDEPYNGTKTDPEEHFKDSFGVYRGEAAVDVELHFKRELSSFVKERSWHASQRVIAKGDGTATVQLHVALTPELTQWILGFGSMVTVTNPPQLKASLQLEAKKLLDLYSGKLKKAA